MNLNKAEIVKQYGSNENDTGISSVQVAILSAEIKALTEHLKGHKKDNSTRRGLIAKVNKRRKLLDYLKLEDPGACEKIVSELNIRYQ